MKSRLEKTGSYNVSEASDVDVSDVAQTTLSKSDFALTAAGRGLNDLSLISPIMAGFTIIRSLLFILPILDGIVLLILCSYAAWVSIVDEKLNLPTRIAKFILLMALVAIVVASFAVTLYALPIAIFAIVCADRLWNIGNAICKMLAGDWKKIKDDIAEVKSKLESKVLSHEYRIQLLNQLRALQKKDREQFFDVTNNLHGLTTALISLTGVILLIPPFTAIGTCILLGIGVYNLLDKFDLNPLRWFANRFFGEWKALKDEIDQLNSELKNPELIPEIRQEKEKLLAELKTQDQNEHDSLIGKMHNMTIVAAGLVGAILLIPPFTSIGLCVLGAVGLYTLVAKKFDFNPVRWVIEQATACKTCVSTTATVCEELLTIPKTVEASSLTAEDLQQKQLEVNKFLQSLELTPERKTTAHKESSFLDKPWYSRQPGKAKNDKKITPAAQVVSCGF